MLDYNILKNKNKLTNKTEEYIDLLSNSVNLNIDLNGEIIYINEYYVARPDLVSLAKYGTDMYADIICKINGISNPFELNKGMYIIIPNINIIDNYLKSSNKDSELIDESDTNVLSKNLNNYQKNVNDKRSPNNQLVGKSNYIIDKSLGVIFY